MLVLTASPSLDLSREANGAVAIELDYKVDAFGVGPVKLLAYSDGLKPSGEGIDIGPSLSAAAGNGWKTMSIPLSCFGKAGLDLTKLQSPLAIKTATKLDISVSRIAMGTSAQGMVSC